MKTALKLFIAQCFLTSHVLAGLPPTTLRGYNDTTPAVTFGFNVPYSQAINNGVTGYVETGNENLLKNGSFEANSTTSWSLAHSAVTSAFPSTNATAGTAFSSAGGAGGGSAANGNLSIATVSSSQINGGYSLSYVSSSATTAGDLLISSAFSIPLKARAKMLTVKFSYNINANASNGNFSGTSSNSFGVAFYDVTNAAWTMPAGVWNIVQSSGVGIAIATFQTDSSVTQGQIAFFNANATAGGITVYLDDFSVGMQTASRGPAMTDWIAYTPTGSWVSNTTYTGLWRRVGDQMEIKVKAATSGAPTNAALTASIPSGYTIDTTKVNTTTSDRDNFGTATFDDAGSATYGGYVGYNSTTIVDILVYQAAASGSTVSVNGGSTSTTVPFTWGSGDSVVASFKVPITGWSSNTSMSNDTDTRVVAAIISGDPASATSGNPIIVPTVGYDSHGAYNATTGRYTVAVSGVYKMFGALTSASSATTLTIYKNAVSTSLAGNLDSNGEATFSGAVNAVAGDIIDIRPAGTVDATNMTLNIERVSGPAVIAATESVNARYYASATSISGSLATVSWTTKDFDSHNAMSAGTYTVPVSGKYFVSTAVAQAATYALNNQLVLEIQKNGTAVTRVKVFAAAATTDLTPAGSDTISCVAGDTIRVQVSNGGTVPTIISSNFENFISIIRVGN